MATWVKIPGSENKWCPYGQYGPPSSHRSRLECEKAAIAGNHPNYAFMGSKCLLEQSKFTAARVATPDCVTTSKPWIMYEPPTGIIQKVKFVFFLSLLKYF